MIGFKNIAAVVVTYNGDASLKKTLLALLEQVSFIIVVDNGSIDNTKSIVLSLGDSNKFRLIELSANMGLGYALNAGIRYAYASGYDWVLTMDQDSIICDGMIDAFISFIKENNEEVCLTPNLIIHGESINLTSGVVDLAITSGNLVYVPILDHVGWFNELLFIDSIDFDFCIRLKNAGYHVSRVGNALLKHELGDSHENIFILNKYYTKHSPLRRYYMLRNSFYIFEMHCIKNVRVATKLLIGNLLSMFLVLLFEEQRRKNSFYYVKGFFHYLSRRKGKYE
ncbi:glycosyltransferase family 2 protein [Deefgea tanakiae]|uniref:Glycosyltransferase family 2 protein n=1 Tax=Deefgea tanakiae TaxID=2865840 RepID=A0ABX8ZAG0_9NEIS|nr:glycosyltransferase family 2 protein [Deefgea tanakiae]QZA78314.1 glycosyltransferase family 2 protein [Deefgea tanakiae]